MLIGVSASAAETVSGRLGLYFIAYEGAIDRAEAEAYATQTNAWLRREGIPRERADLDVAGFVTRQGKLTSGCNVVQAITYAITDKDRSAIREMLTRYDWVVPVVIGPNREGCWFAGQARLGAPGILLVTAGLRPSERVRVFQHELGHNLGVGHFSSAPLDGRAPQLLRPKESVRGSEYGDSSSIMGRGTRLTFTDRLLLGSLPRVAGWLATPQRNTYVIQAKGKRDRLLAIPSGNRIRVTLEYSPQRGVEARTIHGTDSLLWVGGGGGGFRKGESAKVGGIGVRVIASGGSTATVQVTWPRDTDGPQLEKPKGWGKPWYNFIDALEDYTSNFPSLTPLDEPLTLDHTTVPTYLDLRGDDEYAPVLLPGLTDAGWVSSATLTINDVIVHSATTDDRTFAPAGMYADMNGQPEPIGSLERIPLYEGRNTLSYVLVDTAGNESAFHYRFDLGEIYVE